METLREEIISMFRDTNNTATWLNEIPSNIQINRQINIPRARHIISMQIQTKMVSWCEGMDIFVEFRNWICSSTAVADFGTTPLPSSFRLMHSFLK